VRRASGASLLDPGLEIAASVRVCASAALTDFSVQTLLRRVVGRRLGTAPHDNVVRGAADHVGQVGGIERWDNEIERPGFNGFDIEPRVHNTRHDDDIHGERCLLGDSQNIRPRAIGQVGVGKDQLGGLLDPEQAFCLGSGFGMANPHAQVL